MFRYYMKVFFILMISTKIVDFLCLLFVSQFVESMYIFMLDRQNSSRKSYDANFIHLQQSRRQIKKINLVKHCLDELDHFLHKPAAITTLPSIDF